jgi:hypothetical protein
VGPSRLHLALLGLCAVALMGACPPKPTLRIVAPPLTFLTDDSVGLFAEVSSHFDPATLAVEIDGVDLVDALGLVPPWSGVSGVVMVGATSVAVSGFSFDPNAPGPLDPIRVTLEGLAPASHTFTVSAVRTSTGVLASVARAFGVVDAFAEAAHILPSAGQVGLFLSGGGSQESAVLGDPLAAGPVIVPGSDELRPGFTHAANALVREEGP